MFIAILGRQPEISIAELEAVYGTQNVQKISNQAATINCDNLSIDNLGGTIKYGQVITKMKSQNQITTPCSKPQKLLLKNTRKNFRIVRKK